MCDVAWFLSWWHMAVVYIFSHVCDKVIPSLCTPSHYLHCPFALPTVVVDPVFDRHLTAVYSRCVRASVLLVYADLCMMSTDGDPPMAVSSDQFAQLMAAIQASQERFDNKFAEFCAEVRHGQEDAAANAVKKCGTKSRTVSSGKATKSRRDSTRRSRMRSPKHKSTYPGRQRTSH